MRTFDIPEAYRSPVIGKVKALRKVADPRKGFVADGTGFRTVRFVLPRHFGFCFGVENAIEIAYKAVAENPGKRLWLLSQMIHNPEVNADLESQGIGFLMDTEGGIITLFEALSPDDVVIVPAVRRLRTRVQAGGHRCRHPTLQHDLSVCREGLNGSPSWATRTTP